MVRAPLRYVLVATVTLTGCSALLDVKNIYFEQGSSSADGGSDGSPTTEGGGPGDAGPDSTPCTDTMDDANHCGRCGHSCLGGKCITGVCQAHEVASLGNAPLSYLALSDQYIFASTDITLSTQLGGIWRAPKAGGAPELYSSLTDATAMVVVGELLYFVVYDYIKDGTPNQTGGLYSCPVTGPAPCSPTLIAAAESPFSVAANNGSIFYSDDRTGKGLMAYTPPAAPVVFRADYQQTKSLFVDGPAAYYLATLSLPQTPSAKLLEILPDGGFVEKYLYLNANAEAGRLVGNANDLFLTAYDRQTTTGGVVRRVPRTAGGTPCDIGGVQTKRPYGIYTDDSRVYWTNLGDQNAAEPFAGGSVASCERTGCCTTPNVMWTGNGQPEGITGDAEAIYFVTRTTGSIWKIAKP